MSAFVIAAGLKSENRKGDSMSCRAVLLVYGFLMAAAAAAQVPAAERIPIRDPEELAALRLPRDSKNVYRWSGADLGRGLSTAATATSSPEVWGALPGYTTIMGYELTGLYDNYDYLAHELDGTYCRYNPPYLPAQEAIAQLTLPDGVTLAQLQFWAYDDDPNFALTFQILESCQPVGFDPPSATLIASAETFGSIGTYFGFTPLNGFKVNNRECGYSVRVVFVPPDFFCRGMALQVHKMQVSWLREVAPAPSTATFGDVPTSHAFFQFVEALVKSGTTGGCGGGNFCPDLPLNRGQMAVFLAKSLGLAWP